MEEMLCVPYMICVAETARHALQEWRMKYSMAKLIAEKELAWRGESFVLIYP